MDEYEPDEYDVTPALGAVVETGRGSLPFALIHGEALVACASWALGDAGVTAVDLGTEWAGLVDSGEPFVLHDPLCPMTPASFIAACVARAVETGTVVVGVRPVTDTVKTLTGADVGGTVDREELRSIASPIVLPADVVASLDGIPTTDFAGLVEWLRSAHPVQLLEAPAAARRVTSEDDVRLLEELTRPAPA
jgi:2-C-methyl-D-erythritol 4-phosphate cytidylyltransferase